MNFSGPKKDWEKPTIEMHPGRIIGIFDVGTQPGFKDGDPDKAQIIVEYELVGDTKNSEGKNFRISEFLGATNHSKSTLMARYQSLTGTVLAAGNPDKYGGFRYILPPDFSEKLFALAGQACLVNVVVKESGDPKVGTVSKPMKGMTVPESESSAFTLDMDADNFLDQYETCPLWIKAFVQKSREWTKVLKKELPAGFSDTKTETKYEDDIPF